METQQERFANLKQERDTHLEKLMTMNLVINLKRRDD